MAYDCYMKGDTIPIAAKKADLKEWQIFKLANTGAVGRKSWAVQRKEARSAFIKNCNALTKVNLSRAFNTTSEVLTKCLEQISKDIDENNLRGTDALRAADILLKGIERLHEIFMPAVKQPLVNINVPTKQKRLEPTEIEIKEKLTDWGLNKANDDTSE